MDAPKQALESEQEAQDNFILSNIDSVVSKFLDNADARGDLLCYYAKLKYKKFAEKGKMEDLTEAILRQDQGLQVTLKNDPTWAERLNNLGVMFESRFERNGRLEDLEEAIRRAE